MRIDLGVDGLVHDGAGAGTESRGKHMSIATLYVLAGRFFRSECYYDTDNNKHSRRCSAQGYVWNTESKSSGKSCTVTFIKGASDEFSDFAKKRGIPSAYGSVTVSRCANPEGFQSKTKGGFLFPVEVVIRLDEAAYDKAEESLASSIKCDHEASICVKFDGSNADAGYCSLESLDASEASTYPIVCCEISSGFQGKTKIEMPRRAQSADKCATLTFTAANATIDSRIKNSELCVAEIKLDGKLHCTKLDLDCEDVLEVREYPNRQGETLPGSVFVAKDEDSTHCSPVLYATHETMKSLAALFSGIAKGDTVKLSVSMITDGLPLEIGDRKHFDVSSYAPTITKVYA